MVLLDYLWLPIWWGWGPAAVWNAYIKKKYIKKIEVGAAIWLQMKSKHTLHCFTAFVWVGGAIWLQMKSEHTLRC